MTTTGEMIKHGSLLAAAAMTTEATYKYHFVTVGSSGVALTGANGAAHGVLMNLPDAAEPCELAAVGFVKVKAGGAITKGDFVKSDSAGCAVTASAADRLSGYVLGWATATASTNDLVQIFFTPNSTSMTGEETKTSGALTIGVQTSFLSVTSAVAFTLGDGTYVGQRKTLICTVAATSPAGTLTINDAYSTEPTSWVFNAVGQLLELEWTATGWKLIRMIQAGSEALTGASTTANPLNLTHVWSIDGTDDLVLADGVLGGQRANIACAAAANTPIGTVSGVFRTAAGAATGTDLNFNAASDQAIVVWDGAAWVSELLTSVTIS